MKDGCRGDDGVAARAEVEAVSSSASSGGGRGQRGWVLAAWDDVSRRAGRGGLGQCVLVWAGVG